MGGYIPPRSRFPRALYERRVAKRVALLRAVQLAHDRGAERLALDLREIADDYAVPPRSLMAPDSPMFQARPDVVLPSMIPGIPREPWTATVERTGRWSYRLHVGCGGLRLTVDDADPRAYGSREHAERKAKRLVDRQNRAAWLAEREAEGGTIIR